MIIIYNYNSYDIYNNYNIYNYNDYIYNYIYIYKYIYIYISRRVIMTEYTPSKNVSTTVFFNLFSLTL